MRLIDVSCIQWSPSSSRIQVSLSRISYSKRLFEKFYDIIKVLIVPYLYTYVRLLYNPKHVILAGYLAKIWFTCNFSRNKDIFLLKLHVNLAENLFFKFNLYAITVVHFNNKSQYIIDWVFRKITTSRCYFSENESIASPKISYPTIWCFKQL